jgi:hypothetical protein
MATGFRNAHRIDSGIYGDRSGENLDALLQQAIQQQRVRRDDDLSLIEAASDWRLGNSGNLQGLLGRLAALRTDDNLQVGGASGVAPPSGTAPNFRQLSRLNVPSPLSATNARGVNGAWSSASPASYGSGELNLPAGAEVGAQGSASPPVQLTELAPEMRLGRRPQIFTDPYPAPVPSAPTVPAIPRRAAPDWWDTATQILRLLPLARLGVGGGGGKRNSEDDNDDYCGKRMAEETGRCWARKDDYVHPDYLYGCLDRAKDRWRMCRRNGGKPDPSEPPEWGPADEETWRNFYR